MKHLGIYLWAGSLAALAQAGVAQAAEPAAASPDDGSAIIVTGTRVTGLRAVDSAAPISVIDSGALSHVGQPNLNQALTQIAPSFAAESFGGDAANLTLSARLRGLSPNHTLVLVNGKRRHNSAQITAGSGDASGVNPVDFDLIPVSQIGRVEVLKDSAAAQYGSDAVAGVVNVKLKTADHGFGAAFTGGSLYGGNGSLGSWKGEADAGFKLGDGGFLHISGDIRHRGAAWWNFPATNTNFYGNATTPDAAAQAKNATWNRDGAHNGDPKIDAWDVSYNARLPLGNVSL
jgi:iron complex outermembrane receptor protein